MPVDTEYSILKNVLNDQNDLIQRIAIGQPLTDVLNAVTTRFEDEAGAAYQASVFLLNADGLSLSFKAGKRLEPDLIANLNGLPIERENTTIGQTAYTCSFAASEDIENCHLWKSYRSHALRHGIAATWSLPLLDQEKNLAGVFVVFSTEKGQPDSHQLLQSELSVHILQLVLAFSKIKSVKSATANEKNRIAHVQNEERFQNLVRNASIGIIVLKGKDMIVDVVNEMYGKLINRTPEQLLNLPLFRIIPEAEATFRPLIENVLLTGESNYLYEQPYHVVAQGRHIHGYLNIIYQPYLDADGTTVGVMVLCHDITELVVARKKIELSEAEIKNFSTTLERKVVERTLELEDANNRLASINDELQQFAYVTSHDLQEPLRKIKVFSRLAADNLDDRLKAGGYLNRVLDSANRMTGLIQSILHYSLVTNQQARYEQVDLNVLINAILGDYELLIDQKDAQIEVSQLPVIEAIPLQMNQLFFNLVGNALKFAKRGVKPYIKISARVLDEIETDSFRELIQEKRYVEIRVEDNGIGFDQVYASKIFTIFQRLNSESSMGGYGIGLALCKKVVDAHKGQITAEGRVNVGASFLIILPIEQLN